MDWKPVGQLLASVAPSAGAILGGFIPFPGAAFIGQKFGEIIASKFGVAATPAAVSQAIAANPNEVVLARINAAMTQARAEIEGFVEIEKAWAQVVKTSIEQANATMRLEMLPENRHWFYTGWRPACGWVLVFNSALFGLMLIGAAFVAVVFRAGEPLKILTDAWPLFASYFGALGAVVGVAIYSRTKDKEHGVDTSTVAAKPPAKKP